MDSANDYWDTLLSFNTHELDCWGLEDAFSGYSDSSSPDGIASSSAAKKSIAQERDRRKKFNEKLYALRSLVPSITKMDKVSIVKDAIDYIAELQEQERMLLAEISALEQDNGRKRVRSDRRTPPGKRRRFPLTSESTATSPVNVEVQVSDAGDSSCTVSVACSGKRDIVGRLCHALEFLPFDILAASITSFSGNVLHTLLLHTRGTDGRLVEETIKEALGAL